MSLKFQSVAHLSAMCRLFAIDSGTWGNSSFDLHEGHHPVGGSATGVVGQSGECGVQRNGTQEPVASVVGWSQELRAGRCDRRQRGSAAECQGISHFRTRRQFNEQIFLRMPLPLSKRRLIIGEDDQPGAVLSDGPNEVERFVAMAGGEDAAEVAIPGRCFRQQDGAVSRTPQFGAKYGFDSGCAGDIKKSNGAVQAVRVGERQSVTALHARRLAERFQ